MRKSLIAVLLVCSSLLYGQQVTEYEYWFNHDYEDRIKTPTSSGEINLSLDVSQLADGIHVYHFRAKDTKGFWSAPVTQYFLRTPAIPKPNFIAAYEYWIDKDYEARKKVAGNNPVIDLELNLNDLTTGIHHITFRSQDNHGFWSAPVTQYFYKPAVTISDNKIAGYEYWFNDAIDERRTIDLPIPLTPYEINNQWIEVENLLSDATPENFEFEVDPNGYARIYYLNANHFNIRFKDLAGQWSNPSVGLFADGAGIEVIADSLFSKVPVTKTKPASNEIHFYKTEALKGDSLIWKTNQPATIQVFDPFGVEVYKATNQSSQSFNGTRVKRDGVYYVLLHSVSSGASQITLDYQHIHKYAVLGYDIKKVGNEGISTMNIIGNGFDASTKVVLTNNDELEIIPDTVVCRDLGKLSAIIDFTDQVKGFYDIHVIFQDTTIVVKNGIEVEESKPIELDVSVIGNSQFRAGSPTVYTIMVKNKGNSTAYGVPLDLCIISNSENAITNIDLSGEMIENKVPDIIKLEDYPQDVADSIYSYYAEREDMDRFLKLYNSIEDYYAYTNMFMIKEIPAYSSSILTITISASSNIEINAVVPKTWQGLSSSDNDLLFETIKTIDECCIIEAVECIVDLVFMYPAIKKVMETLPINKACVSDIIKSTISLSLDIYCEGETPKLNANMGWNFVDLISNSLLSCVELPEGGSAILKRLLKGLEIWGDLQTIWDCGVVAKELVTGKCEKDKDEDNLKPTPVNSFDPNDKLGYRSPSGSTYFKEGITNMTYVINFENDPEKATAAAQDVYITDTLDMTKFDIHSFRAGHIMIGDRIAQAPFDTQKYTWEVDMRPEMNLITRVNLTLDTEKGIAHWHFASIDPVTDEPTTDIFAGFLPPNDDKGSGQGLVSFSINLKDGLPDDVEISNSASIVFDYNEAIITDPWVNKKDIVPPVSKMLQPAIMNEDTLLLEWEGKDEASGIWTYDVYAQTGMDGNWNLLISTESTGTEFDYEYDVRYSFYVVATDKANNREEKEASAEVSITVSEEVSISDINSLPAIKLYPNPVRERLYIESPVAIEKGTIYTLTGSVVLEQINIETSIDLSALSNGVYILKLQTSKGEAVFEVIKR